MKTIRLFAVMASIAILIASCSKNQTNEISPVETIDYLKQADWKVSYYSDKGKDETNNYSGYILSFGENDIFTLSNSQINLSGTWSLNNQSDDSSNSGNKLIISITGNKQADDLQDDWIIVAVNGNSIQLKDDNASGNETLTLVKI